VIEYLHPMGWRTRIQTVVDEGARAGVFEPIAPSWEIAHRIVNVLDGLSFRLVVGYPGVPVQFVRTLMSRFMAEQLGVPQTAIEGDPPIDSAIGAVGPSTKGSLE
jgi:hypothetical protein